MPVFADVCLQESDTLGAISEAGVAGMAPVYDGRDNQRL